MLSMAWTPRSRFRPPQRTHSMQDTMPGRVGGSSSCVGAERPKERERQETILSGIEVDKTRQRGKKS